MNMLAVIRRSSAVLVANALVFILPVGVAADNVPPEALNVKVFPDRYVAAGKQFDDLAALEAWAKPIRIRTVWLDSCGNAATRQLLAAVERFHVVYTEGVQIRTLTPGDPECVEPVPGAASLARGLPAAYEYLATDRSGRGVMP